MHNNYSHLCNLVIVLCDKHLPKYSLPHEPCTKHDQPFHLFKEHTHFVPFPLLMNWYS